MKINIDELCRVTIVLLLNQKESIGIVLKKITTGI